MKNAQSKLRRFSVVIAFALYFTAHSGGAQNLIPDPTFSAGVSAWAPRGVGSSVEWSGAPGADGAPGFARLTAIIGPGAGFARICLPVSGGASYSWGGFLRAVPPLDTDALFILTFFAGSSCADPGLLFESTPALIASNVPEGTWNLRVGPEVVAPASAQSVAFEVELLTGSRDPRSVDFDNVYFGPQGTVPPTAAVAVPTMSEVAIGVFAVLLALVGAWRIAKV